MKILSPIELNIVTYTASTTLVKTDAGKLVIIDSAISNNVTVPPNTDVSYPIGTQIHIYQKGLGQTTIVAGAGVTVLANNGTLVMGSAGEELITGKLTCTGLNTWLFENNLNFTDLTNLSASNLTSGTVPTARLGTGTANSTTYLRGDGSWQTPTAPYGIFGISNSSGIYTYYSTLTLAMASATAGQTIEMFADYTETGAVSITMVAGVIIQGNGHSYNHSHASATHTFLFPTNANYYIYNLQVNRTNATSGAYVFYHVAYSPYTVYCNGTTIRTNKGGVWFHFSQPGNIHNLTAEFSGSGDVGFSGSGSNFNNCTILGTSTSSNILASNGASLNNCTVINRGTGIAVGEVYLNSTTVNSYSSPAANGCYGVRNSWLYSATSYALLPYNNFTVENSIIQSAGSYAAYIYNGNCRFDNCTLISSAGNAFYSSLGGDVKLNNCVLRSSSAVALNAYSVEVTNCTIDSTWNNAGGHAVAVVTNDTVITNCMLRTANASANAIYSASAFSPKFANNTYANMTTPINANITQGITNTHDNQGNILI